MASRKSKLDEEIAELYGGPLGEFTSAKQALAKRLTKEGRKDAAAEVKALPKPSVSAWAVNRLFSREAEAMEELLDAGTRARGALRDIFSGAHPETLREAIQTARDLADDLRRRAAKLLAEELGRAPGQAIVDRIGTNLQSLAFTPAAAAEAARGWLAGDLEPPGFEVLAGLQLAGSSRSRPEARPAAEKKKEKAEAPKPEPKKPAPRDTSRLNAAARRRAEAEAARREREDARKEARLREEREREAEKERREREESRHQERLARVKADHDEIAGRADFLRRKAEQAEAAAEEAQKRADEARQAADQARERSKQADKELTRARKELEKARAEQGGGGQQTKRKRPGG